MLFSNSAVNFDLNKSPRLNLTTLFFYHFTLFTILRYNSIGQIGEKT